MKHFILLLILSTYLLFSAVPSNISWQGVLTDSEDNLLDGNYKITTKLYDAYTEGNELWSEIHTDLEINEGIANIILGSVNPLNLDFKNQYWLEITVGDAEPLPRIILNSVPYSLYSDRTNSIFHGDSLILKDTLGAVRFIFNPNSGSFKMMHNDTVWYQTSVNSPPTEAIRNADDVIVKKEGNITKIYADGKLVIKEETQVDLFGSGGIKEIQTTFDTDGNKFSEHINHKTAITFGDDPGIYTEITTKYFDTEGNKIKEIFILKKDEKIYESYTKENGVITENIENEVNQTSEETTNSHTVRKYDDGVQTSFSNESEIIFRDYQGNVTGDKRSTNKIQYIRGNEYYSENTETGTTIINNETGMVTETTEKKYYPSDDEYTFTEYKRNGNLMYQKVENSGKMYESKSYTDNTTTKKTKTEYFNYTGEKTYEYEEEYDKSNKSRVTRIKDTDGNESTLEQTSKEFNFTGEIASNGPKKFKINHPTNNDKYLQHAAVESNEVLNTYTGNVTTDNEGYATVTLPDYFDELNTDFRYVLTIVGTTFARAIVYSEISGNEFQIKTDQPNIKVSWVVIANRNDAYMQANPFDDEPDK